MWWCLHMKSLLLSVPSVPCQNSQAAVLDKVSCFLFCLPCLTASHKEPAACIFERYVALEGFQVALSYAGASGAPHSDSDPDFVAGEWGGDSDSELSSDEEDSRAGRHARYSIPMGAPLHVQHRSVQPAAAQDVALCSLRPLSRVGVTTELWEK